MVSWEEVIVISSITLFIGGIIGVIIGRSLTPKLQKSLELRLQESKEELDQYQHDVAQHFADTAKLVTNLTQSYKDVHDHLSKGAVELSSAEIAKQVVNAGDSALGIEAQGAVEDIHFEAPKDWAPKVPGQAGTLSEEFGLNDHREPVPKIGQQ